MDLVDKTFGFFYIDNITREVNMVMKTYLTCMYDARKSFYNKAVVVDIDGGKLLESYNTKVAKVVKGKLELLPKWD